MNPKVKKKYNIQQRKSPYNLPTKRPNYNGPAVNLSPTLMTSIFNEKTPNGALRDGRIHCQSVRKTATFIDAYGNKVILRENRTTMNTDKCGPAIEFRENNRKFRKRRH